MTTATPIQKPKKMREFLPLSHTGDMVYTADGGYFAKCCNDDEAELIVRCMNLHYKMVAWIEKCVRWNKSNMMSADETYRPKITEGEELLDTARGESA